MKKARAVLAGAILFPSVCFILHGPMLAAPIQPASSLQVDNVCAYGSNDLWLEIISITNNTASLVIHVPSYVPGTATNNVYNLFFTTNLETPCAWSRVLRCEPGQTNPVVTNLPPTQGFFMLGGPIRLGFDQQILDRNDDGSTPLVPLPFTINFLSNSESALFVNNNGNVTFDGPLSDYLPVNLAVECMTWGVKIIAPFWADVDTRNTNSDVVQYGTNVVHGHNAFGVDWVNVGYYNSHADKLLSCQLVIIDRSDIAPGDFDMEFNYNRVEWQWGDADPSHFYPPRAGYSDGITDFELPGSGVAGAFLDTNTVTGLVYNSLNTPVLGRYLMFFRNGQPLP